MKQEFGNELFWGNNPEPLKNAKQDVMDLDFFVSITGTGKSYSIMKHILSLFTD